MKNKTDSTRNFNMLRRKSKEKDKVSVLKHSNDHSDSSSVGSRNIQWLPLGNYPTRFTQNSFRPDVGFPSVYNDSFARDRDWPSQDIDEPPTDYEDVFQPESTKGSDNWEKNDKSESSSTSFSGDIHPFRRIFLRFADKTSMTGVSFIKNATLPIAKLTWTVLFLGAIGATIFHLTFLFEQYYSYPKQTKVSLGFSNLPIPAVTICNINPIKKSQLHLASRELRDLITFSDPKRFKPKNDDGDGFTTKSASTTRKENNRRHTTVPSDTSSDEIVTTQRNTRGRGTGLSRSSSHNIDTDSTTDQKQFDSMSTSSDLESASHTSSKPTSTNSPSQNTIFTGTTTDPSTFESSSVSAGQESTSHTQSLSPQILSTDTVSFPFGDQMSTTQRERRRGTGRGGDGRTRSTNAINTEATTVPTNLDGVASRPRQRNRRFVDEFDKFNFTEDPMDINQNEGESDSLDRLTKTFYKLYMNEPRSRRYKMGHQLSDMLLQCSIDGKKCPQRNFKTFQTETYGNCYTFQSEKTLIREPGFLYGLQMILYMENDEYIHGITDGYGAHVVIHDQKTVPFPREEGFNIPAATETSIGLKMISIERLGGDYGNCTEKTTFLQKYGVHYTVKTCLTLCRAKAAADMCGCVSEKDQEYLIQTNYTSYNICKTSAERKCLGFLNNKAIVRDLPCNCLQPCSEKQYTKFTSSRQFPSTEYASMLLQSVCEKSPRYCAGLKNQFKDIRQLNMNFLRLKIYFEDLNYEQIIEEPEIGKAQFSSDVGGAIGLWIGLSVLSIFEVIQLVVEILKFCFNRKQKVNELDRKT